MQETREDGRTLAENERNMYANVVTSITNLFDNFNQIKLNQY
jgi:hypothetical protein